VSIDARLKDVFRSIFGSGANTVTDEDSPRTIKGWDSLAHIQLMMALEVEFDLTFEPEEIAELVTVGAIRQRIAGDVGNGDVR
jgi:acyl carrier protein